MDSFLWKIGGEAGFGIMTTGEDFSHIAAKNGYNVAAYAEYPSLIRGGLNTFEVHFSRRTIHASKNPIDLLVCLNKDTYVNHHHRLHPESIVIYDKDSFAVSASGQAHHKSHQLTNVATNTNTTTSQTLVHVPFKDILHSENGSMVMMNVIALAASLAVLQWPLTDIYQIIEKSLAGKPPEVIDVNKRLAQKGYDFVSLNYNPRQFPNQPVREKNNDALILTGNLAFALGLVAADCRLYTAYPMTPSSSVLTHVAEWAQQTGMVVRHAEDEISVINTALGASFAGARSAIGTSGGGFALMTEAISFAGVSEIPLLIFVAQRPGPATGMPSWTEQADLQFVVHAGHGEFPKIVLAPGDVEEMYQITTDAMNLADTYQTPVILLSDKYLSESFWSASRLETNLFLKSVDIDRGKIVDNIPKNHQPYLRYKNTSDGISPMLIPGQKGLFYQSNSYEHTEDGHTSEMADDRVTQVDKRARKTETFLKKHFRMPKTYGVHSGAEVIFVSWGSTKGIILDAIEILEKEGIAAGLIHFTYIHPMDNERVKGIFHPDKRYVLVENNSTLQFGAILRQNTGVHITEAIKKYDGRQIYVEEIVDYVKDDRNPTHNTSKSSRSHLS